MVRYYITLLPLCNFDLRTKVLRESSMGWNVEKYHEVTGEYQTLTSLACSDFGNLCIPHVP
jgi:hypothetical protein